MQKQSKTKQKQKDYFSESGGWGGQHQGASSWQRSPSCAITYAPNAACNMNSLFYTEPISTIMALVD
jgi:hypothetical protein